MIQLKTIHPTVKSFSHELKRQFLVNENEELLISFFGSMSNDVVNGLAENLENMMISRGESDIKIKKMFSIMIEELSNIYHHGSSLNDTNRIGHVLVKQQDSIYTVSFGNVVNYKQKKDLETEINRLNEMDDIQLKMMYQSVMNQRILYDTEEIGAGLITIAIKANSSIDYHFSKLPDDLFYFERRVTV